MLLAVQIRTLKKYMFQRVHAVLGYSILQRLNSLFSLYFASFYIIQLQSFDDQEKL